MSLSLIEDGSAMLLCEYDDLDIAENYMDARLILVNQAFKDIMFISEMPPLPEPHNFQEFDGSIKVVDMVIEATAPYPQGDVIHFVRAIEFCVNNLGQEAQFRSRGSLYITKANIVEEGGKIFGIWTFEKETIDTLGDVYGNLLGTSAPTLLLRFPTDEPSNKAKVVLINDGFADLFLDGVSVGLPTPNNYNEVGEVDVVTIQESSKFLYPNEDWDLFRKTTGDMYRQLPIDSTDTISDIWKFRGDIYERVLTYFRDINGDLLALWTYSVANRRSLAENADYLKASSEIIWDSKKDDPKPFALYLPIKNAEGSVIDLECMWQNAAWGVAAPNAKYASKDRLSKVATERLHIFLNLAERTEQDTDAKLTLPRNDAAGSVNLRSQLAANGAFHLVSFEQIGLFDQLLDQSNPTFIIKINPAEFGSERVVLVNKTYEENFFPLGMPKHFPRTTSFGTTDVSMEEFMAELESEESGGDQFKDANQAFNEQVLNHVLVNGYEGEISGYVSNPLGAFERTATFTRMDNGSVFLTIAFEPVTDDIIMSAPEFARKRIELLGEQVMDLTKAVAAHKPIFDDQENLVDLEFLWANQEFNRWRRKDIEPGMMNSQERVRFEELLPYLQQAWEDGQASQFFTLDSKDPSATVNHIYDYSELFEEQDGKGNQIEVETLFSRTPEGYIIEWGDDINAKIQHGSEIEIQRRLVEDLEKEKVQQRERDHFISEIHDNTLQELFVIGMGLQPFMKDGGPTPTAENVHEFSGAIDRIAKDLRALITNEMEQRDPFDAQLRVLADRYSRISAFDVVFVNTSSDDDGNLERIPQNICDDLSKATQEAISNAVKHSGGDEIKIQLTMEANNILLTIQDNGTGIEDTSIRKSGTRNMAQRIEKHQGNFSIQKLAEHGTSVSFRVDNIPLIKI